MKRIDTFWWNFSVASNMKIPSAVLQFLTVESQKDCTAATVCYEGDRNDNRTTFLTPTCEVIKSNLWVCVYVSQIQLFSRSNDFCEAWRDRYTAGANPSAVFHSLALSNNDVADVRD
jgi:hypothetical protein